MIDSLARKKSKSLDPESVIRVINEELISKSVAKQKIVVDKLSLVPSIILSFKSLRLQTKFQELCHLFTNHSTRNSKNRQPSRVFEANSIKAGQ